jgi:5-methylcytosine-specific restriction endonuclease McrA
MRLPDIRADLDALYRAHQAETQCKHAKNELRRKVASNGAVSFARQCLTCGLQVGSAVKRATLTEQQISALPNWEAALKDHFWRSRSALYAQKRKKADADAYREWMRHYNAYLQTPEWKGRRKLVLLRAQGICEGCRSKPATDAHHVTYAHAGEEFLFELVALCPACHERFHVDALPQPPALVESNENGNCPF